MDQINHHLPEQTGEITCKSFFDALAADWDSHEPALQPARARAAALCQLPPGGRMLDLACGTGVMFRDLLALAPGILTGVDVSPQMCAIARGKLPAGPCYQVVCADILAWPGDGLYDAALLYNAYPHFLDPQALLAKAASLLQPGGRFCVVHGMSRQGINAHHDHVPRSVCRDLQPAAAEAALWQPWFQVTAQIEEADFYAITGQKK